MTCGTRKQYQAGCRCLPCRAANAEYAAFRSRTGDMQCTGCYLETVLAELEATPSGPAEEGR